MKINKKILLELVKQKIDEMPMDFDYPDRPSPDIQSKLEKGDTPLKKIPFPKTDKPNQNFQELLASDRYKQVVQKVRQYTGINTPMIGERGIMPLSQLMMNAHNNILRTERAHKKELEELAIRLVKREMGIPEGSINFDAKIVGMSEIDTNNFNRQTTQEKNIDPVDIEKDLASDLEKLNLEKAKRRFINAMIQGASKKGHYMFHYVSDEIRNITGSDTILDSYGILMSINDTMYWQISDDTMKQMMGGAGQGGGGNIGGTQQVRRNTNPPTIVARGVNFPVLVHELIKGVMELLAIQGRPTDEEGNEMDDMWSDIEKTEDTLEKEIWDLRLGPPLYERIREEFPEEILVNENKYNLQNYLLVSIFKQPPKQFFVFMKEILTKSDRGRKLMSELMKGIEDMFRDENYQEALEVFNDDLNDITDDTDDDDLKDFLGGLGIDLSR